MARGYSQARAETPIARDSGYLKSSRVEPDSYDKSRMRDAVAEKAVSPKAAELLDKYGSGSMQDNENANISKNGKNRGPFMRTYFNGPELEKEFGKDFYKKGWTTFKSDVDGSEFLVKNLGGDIYFKLPRGTTHRFKAEELAENGGRFKDIKEAIDWSYAIKRSEDLSYAKGMEEWIAKGGSLD
jgi:hypothetical protein